MKTQGAYLIERHGVADCPLSSITLHETLRRKEDAALVEGANVDAVAELRDGLGGKAAQICQPFATNLRQMWFRLVRN